MSYTYNSSTSNSAAATNTLSLSPPAGALIVVFSVTSGGGGTPTVTFSDNSGSTWANASNNVNVSGLHYSVGYCLSAASGVTTITATYNGGTPGTVGLSAIAYTGMNLPSFVAVTSPNVQASPGTGSNAVTANALACGSINALFVVMSADVTAGNDALVAGTGYTVRFDNSASLNGMQMTIEDPNAEVTGSQTGTFTATSHSTDTFGTLAIAFADNPALPSTTSLTTNPGPGVSPSARDQFHVPVRDSSSPNNALTGYVTAVSTSYGLLASQGNMSGRSFSVSTDYGQLIGTGGMPGIVYGVSIDYGVLGQSPVLTGFIPKGGPGISPASLFQFSTLVLDETLNTALIQGQIIGNASTDFGLLVGTGGMSGYSASVSTVWQSNSFVTMSGYSASASTLFGDTKRTGGLTGYIASVSTDYGAMASATLTQIQGNSYSASTFYGAMQNLILTQIQGQSFSESILYAPLVASSLKVVPNVVGMTQLNATITLAAAGFNNIAVGFIYDLITPPGSVAQQNPVGGTLYSLGNTVTIIISAGPFVPGAPPLPPMKVTIRNFSLEEMVSRDWGPSFRAPDHRVYQFSNDRGFDSTDQGNTGFYNKGTSTS